jgi:AbrB family looped-hinge helix DNA binding protein
METSVLTSKWQIVIPKNIRKKYRIKPGTRIGFIEKNGELLIRPLDKEYFRQFAGILSGKGDVLKALMEEKAREREL